jgi:hypothetical protein
MTEAPRASKKSSYFDVQLADRDAYSNSLTTCIPSWPSCAAAPPLPASASRNACCGSWPPRGDQRSGLGVAGGGDEDGLGARAYHLSAAPARPVPAGRVVPWGPLALVGAGRRASTEVVSGTDAGTRRFGIERGASSGSMERAVASVRVVDATDARFHRGGHRRSLGRRHPRRSANGALPDWTRRVGRTIPRGVQLFLRTEPMGRRRCGWTRTRPVT